LKKIRIKDPLIGYFKNLKELSSFMKESTKNWWFIRRLFDFKKKIENHNYSPIPTQALAPLSAWSSLTWVVNWQLWQVHYKWKHSLGDKCYLQKLKPNLFYLVVLKFDGQECIPRTTLMHKGGYYQKNKRKYNLRYWINKLIDNRKV